MNVNRTITGDEPVKLQDIKRYLRISHNDEDEDLYQMITHAREMLETLTGRSLVEQEIEIETQIIGQYDLPYEPITEIEKITIDGEDVIDEVEINSIEGVGLLSAKYKAGPYECKFAVKELVAHIYMNRGTEIGLPTLVKTWISQNTINVWLA